MYLQILRVIDPQRESILRSFWYLQHVCECMKEAIILNHNKWHEYLARRDHFQREYEALKGEVGAAMELQIRQRSELAAASKRPFKFDRREVVAWLQYEDSLKWMQMLHHKSTFEVSRDACRQLEDINDSLCVYMAQCEKLMSNAEIAMNSRDVTSKMKLIPGVDFMQLTETITNQIKDSLETVHESSSSMLMANHIFNAEVFDHGASRVAREGDSARDSVLEEIFSSIPGLSEELVAGANPPKPQPCIPDVHTSVLPPNKLRGMALV